LGLEPSIQQNEASWVVAIVEDMRYQGVTEALSDAGWIKVQTNDDGSITWKPATSQEAHVANADDQRMLHGK